MNETNGLDIELKLRDHYRTMDVGSSAALAARVVEALDRVPARRWPVLQLSRRVATGAAIAAVGLAVVAVVAGPLWFGSTVPAGPSTSPTASASPSVSATPTASGTATGNPDSTQTPHQSTAPDPSTLLASARASALGRMGSGGVWAVQGTEFLRMPDANGSVGNSPWPASDTVPRAVFVLNKDRAWTVTLAPGSVPGGQGPPYDHLNVVVNRTSGGSTWTQASVPGDYTDCELAISFAGPLVGYLVASPHHGGGSMILATGDGGATWNVVASVHLQHGGLGAELTASDADTIWSGGQAESSTNHPVLALSRDSGRNWSEVTLPGLEGQWGGDGSVEALGPPVFVDPSVGFFTVLVNGTDPEVFGTTDAGRTWSLANFPSGLNAVFGSSSWSGADFVDATHWAAAVGSTVQLTSDAGKIWKSSLGQGLPAGKFIKLAFVDATTGYGLFQPEGGTDYYLYRTSNGGDEWSLQYGTIP